VTLGISSYGDLGKDWWKGESLFQKFDFHLSWNPNNLEVEKHSFSSIIEFGKLIQPLRLKVKALLHQLLPRLYEDPYLIIEYKLFFSLAWKARGVPWNSPSKQGQQATKLARINLVIRKYAESIFGYIMCLLWLTIQNWTKNLIMLRQVPMEIWA
jgi:hypothetical protein